MLVSSDKLLSESRVKLMSQLAAIEVYQGSVRLQAIKHQSGI